MSHDIILFIITAALAATVLYANYQWACERVHNKGAIADLEARNLELIERNIRILGDHTDTLQELTNARADLTGVRRALETMTSHRDIAVAARRNTLERIEEAFRADPLPMRGSETVDLLTSVMCAAYQEPEHSNTVVDPRLILSMASRVHVVLVELLRRERNAAAADPSKAARIELPAGERCLDI